MLYLGIVLAIIGFLFGDYLLLFVGCMMIAFGWGGEKKK